MMKFIAIVGMVLLLKSCSGDDTYVDPHRQYDYGSISALKNGEPWSANIHGADNNGQFSHMGIDVNVYDGQGYRREDISIQFIPKEEIQGNLIRSCGTNCIIPFQASYRTISDDGDVICDRYDIVEELPDENQIEIIEYNTQTKEFKGTFKAVFAIDENREKCNPNAPDTIRFSNGQFHSKITR